MKIEEGSVPTPYEPYGKYKIPVKVSGKNLLDLTKLQGITSSGSNASSTKILIKISALVPWERHFFAILHLLFIGFIV